MKTKYAEKWETLSAAEKRSMIASWSERKDTALKGISIASMCDDMETEWLEAIGFRGGRLVHVSSEDWSVRPVTVAESVRLFAAMEAKATEIGADGHAGDKPRIKWLKLVEKVMPGEQNSVINRRIQVDGVKLNLSPMDFGAFAEIAAAHKIPIVDAIRKFFESAEWGDDLTEYCNQLKQEHC